MITEENNLWIKIEPIKMKSEPSNLSIFINDEKYDYEIYDKTGHEFCKIYFQGKNVKPKFFLKTQSKNYRIDFNSNEIRIKSLLNIKNINNYIKNNCNCKSSEASCWGNAIYYTRRSEKPPFNEM